MSAVVARELVHDTGLYEMLMSAAVTESNNPWRRLQRTRSHAAAAADVRLRPFTSDLLRVINHWDIGSIGWGGSAKRAFPYLRNYFLALLTPLRIQGGRKSKCLPDLSTSRARTRLVGVTYSMCDVVCDAVLLWRSDSMKTSTLTGRLFASYIRLLKDLSNGKTIQTRYRLKVNIAIKHH